SERDALIALYNENPTNSLDWDTTSTDISTWSGVYLNGEGFIVELHVQGQNLEVLPQEIGQLINLEVLNLYENQFTSIPSEIGQLTNLISLRADENQLTSIPSEIGQLNSLAYLDLEDNQITSLPPEIGQLANLI